MSEPMPDETPVDPDEQGWKGGASADNHGWSRLGNKLRDHDSRLAAQRAAAPLRQAGVHAVPGGLNVEGNFTLRDGGNLTVQYPDAIGGDSALFVGDLYANDGTGEYLGTGMLIERPDGTNVLDSVSNDAGTAHSFYLRDNEENAVLGVAAATSRGLTMPTFQPNMTSTDYLTWAGADSSTWFTVSMGGTYLFSSHVWAVLRATSDNPDTSGQVRFVITHDGTDYPLGAAASVGFAVTAPTVHEPVPAAIPIGAWVNLHVQARRTAGTGKVRATATSVSMMGS